MILCLPQTVAYSGWVDVDGSPRIVELKDSKKMMMNEEDIRDYTKGSLMYVGAVVWVCEGLRGFPMEALVEILTNVCWRRKNMSFRHRERPSKG